MNYYDGRFYEHLLETHTWNPWTLQLSRSLYFRINDHELESTFRYWEYAFGYHVSDEGTEDADRRRDTVEDGYVPLDLVIDYTSSFSSMITGVRIIYFQIIPSRIIKLWLVEITILHFFCYLALRELQLLLAGQDLFYIPNLLPKIIDRQNFFRVTNELLEIASQNLLTIWVFLFACNPFVLFNDFNQGHMHGLMSENKQFEGILGIKFILYEINPLLMIVSVVVLLVALIGAYALSKKK